MNASRPLPAGLLWIPRIMGLLLVGVSLGFFLPGTIQNVREYWKLKHAPAANQAASEKALKALYPKLTASRG